MKTIFSIELKTALSERGFSFTASPNQCRSEKRITHPDVFPKYFMLEVPSEELSDELVESVMSKWDTTPSQEIPRRLANYFGKYKSEDNLLEFLDKLILFSSRISRPVAVALIDFL